MFNFYSRLTPAQQLVISGVASILGTALVVTLAATYQLYTEQGQLNIGVLINFAVLTFAALISKSLHDFVPAHIKDELQAARDSESQAHDALARSQAITQTAINKNVVQASQSQPGPLVVIHSPFEPVVAALKPTDVQTVATPSPDVSKLETASVPVPQLPFPPTGEVVPQTYPVEAQPTMTQLPALHFGDSGIIPVVPAP